MSTAPCAFPFSVHAASPPFSVAATYPPPPASNSPIPTQIHGYHPSPFPFFSPPPPPAPTPTLFTAPSAFGAPASGFPPIPLPSAYPYAGTAANGVSPAPAYPYTTPFPYPPPPPVFFQAPAYGPNPPPPAPDFSTSLVEAPVLGSFAAPAYGPSGSFPAAAIHSTAIPPAPTREQPQAHPAFHTSTSWRQPDRAPAASTDLAPLLELHDSATPSSEYAFHSPASRMQPDLAPAALADHALLLLLQDSEVDTFQRQATGVYLDRLPSSSTINKKDSTVLSHSTLDSAPDVFGEMPTPRSGYDSCSGDHNTILSTCVPDRNINLSAQNLDRMPQAYGFQNLDQQQACDRTAFDAIQGQLAKITSMISQFAVSLSKQPTSADASKPEQSQHITIVPAAPSHVASQVFEEMPTPIAWQGNHGTATREPVFDAYDDETDGSSTEFGDMFTSSPELLAMSFHKALENAASEQVNGFSKAPETEHASTCLNITSDVQNFTLELRQQDDERSSNCPVLKTSDSYVTRSNQLGIVRSVTEMRLLWDPGPSLPLMSRNNQHASQALQSASHAPILTGSSVTRFSVYKCLLFWVQNNTYVLWKSEIGMPTYMSWDPGVLNNLDMLLEKYTVPSYVQFMQRAAEFSFLSLTVGIQYMTSNDNNSVLQDTSFILQKATPFSQGSYLGSLYCNSLLKIEYCPMRCLWKFVLTCVPQQSYCCRVPSSQQSNGIQFSWDPGILILPDMLLGKTVVPNRIHSRQTLCTLVILLGRPVSLNQVWTQLLPCLPWSQIPNAFLEVQYCCLPFILGCSYSEPIQQLVCFSRMFSSTEALLSAICMSISSTLFMILVLSFEEIAEGTDGAALYQISIIQLPMRNTTHVWNIGIDSLLLVYIWRHIQKTKLVNCTSKATQSDKWTSTSPNSITSSELDSIIDRWEFIHEQGVQNNYKAKNLLFSPHYLQIKKMDIIFKTFRPP